MMEEEEEEEREEGEGKREENRDEEEPISHHIMRNFMSRHMHTRVYLCSIYGMNMAAG